MTEYNFFANRAVAKIATGSTTLGDINAAWENGSNTVTFASNCTGTVAIGDYIYNFEDDTVFNASRVASIGGVVNEVVTLEYGYKGTTNAASIGYEATLSTIAVLKGMETTVNYEHVSLYGTDSIIRQDVAKHSAKVEVKIKYAKFDPNPVNDWAQRIIHPTAVTDGTMEDTNTVFLPEVLLLINTGGATPVYQEIMIKDVYFESLPTPMPENEFIVRDLTGEGSNISFRTWS